MTKHSAYRYTEKQVRKLAII